MLANGKHLPELDITVWKSTTLKEVYTNQNADLNAVSIATKQHFENQQKVVHIFLFLLWIFFLVYAICFNHKLLVFSYFVGMVYLKLIQYRENKMALFCFAHLSVNQFMADLTATLPPYKHTIQG